MVHPRTAAVALLLLGASLARAATVAGVLPGALAVEPSGAASYAIPIEVPPGTAGMAPSLSLVYNSQGGNGLLGVGWSLGGLSSITRCPRTPAQDSARGAIGYDTDDRFCLDGQRLVAVSGTYGGDGTEYRTEIDTFAQVYSYGSAGTGPAWFEVRTKSGQTMEYGKTADARIEAVGKSEARQWALSRVTDTVGNYLTVSYREEDGQGYPSRMDYTGYMTSGTPYASVRFEYGSRHDIRLFSSGGSRVRADERLTKVKTYVGATLVGEYRLTYASAGLPQPSRVVKVERCDRSGHCLPATDYTWSDLGDGTFHPPRWSTPRNSAGWSNYKSVVGDFNGDGLADLAWTNQGNSGLRVDVSLSNAPSDSGRIASITSATGPSFTLDYAPLTEGGGVSTPRTRATMLVRCRALTFRRRCMRSRR